jgi:hypothetical protein
VIAPPIDQSDHGVCLLWKTGASLEGENPGQWLRTHRGARAWWGNYRGSIFWLLVGEALLIKKGMNGIKSLLAYLPFLRVMGAEDKRSAYFITLCHILLNSVRSSALNISAQIGGCRSFFF